MVDSSGPGAQQYCSNEDGHASPVMKRRWLVLQGHYCQFLRIPFTFEYNLIFDKINNVSVIQLLYNMLKKRCEYTVTYAAIERFRMSNERDQHFVIFFVVVSPTAISLSNRQLNN